MPDDPSKRGKQDRERININQRFERIGWAKRLGVNQGHLRAAVKQVVAAGHAPTVARVKEWLIEWIEKA